MTKKICILIMFAVLCLLTACGAPDLDEVATTVADEEDCSFILPADWERVEPTSANGVCAFRSAEGDLTLEVVRELGAMEYYSLDELGDTVAEKIAGDLFAAEPEREQRSGNDKYSCLMQGTDADGSALACRVDLYMPYPSAHYYLVYLATPDAYAANKKIADGILDGFTVTKSAEEMYMYIDEQRDAAAAAAREDAAGGENPTDGSAEDGDQQE